MAYAGPGYCEIFSDTEGTLTAPYTGRGELPNSSLQGCMNEGVLDVEGNRVCVLHLVTMLDLMLMLDRHVDVRYIDA